MTVTAANTKTPQVSEREYLDTAFASVEPWLYLLPSDVQRSMRLAKSVVQTRGSATSEELRRELGENWVIARRTKSIVKKYGASVKCYTIDQYRAAERRAIENRFPVTPAVRRRVSVVADQGGHA